ncbi:MAG: YqgE/AlgH family protein [Rudaea sp.]|nr:YqgE/AlgH family protein [Rudaea sp.]MBR0346758.1 YqgE/AlgH family protein [Rudaea sp.]
MPNMRDPSFVRSVALICQHSSEGAMGVVVNRLSEYRLGDVLAQMGLKSSYAEVEDAPVLIGGPVQPERGFVLHSSDGTWESSYKVSDTLSVTTSRDVLVAIAEGRGPRQSVVALGYAGWGAGQLEEELKQNAWLTTEPDERILFDMPLEQRWDAAAKLIGVSLANLSSFAGNA